MGHKERLLKYEIKNPEKIMCKGAKYRAIKKNIHFSITYKDIHIPKICPILGIPLKLNKGGRPGFFDDSPSLDRVIPEKGYVPENIRVISNRANRLKSNATAKEMRLILKDLEQIENSK